MSGYADVRGFHSGRTSGDGHCFSDGVHADAYQTVEELTERLEAEGAAAAHTRLTGEGERRKGPHTFASALLAPPSPSSATWNAADVIALYMRRQRYAIQTRMEEDEEVTVATAAAVPAAGVSMAHHVSSSSRMHDGRLLESYSPKVLLLGDDAVAQELAATLRAGAEEMNPKLLNSDESNSTTSFSQGPPTSPMSATALPLPEVYTIPDAIEGLAALRAELCRWCDVVLFCYHVADPASFEHLRNEVVPAVLAACSTDDETKEEEVGRAIGRPSSKFGSADTTAVSQSSVWPAVAPPFILVGLGAEARLSRPTNLGAPWITNADVLGFATEAGVQRVVELYSHNPRHVQILLQHCRALRDVGYEGLPSLASQGRRAALKELGLHALLRAPPPMLELHPGSRTVHVALPPRIPTSTAIRFPAKSKTGSSASDRARDGGIQCYYAVSDAADMDAASVTPSHLVPTNGVLSYADIYDAYTQSTGRPVQHAAAVQLSVCAAVPYLFPSELVQQRIPTPAAPPSGYVDVVHRCCRLTMPPPSFDNASHGQRGGRRSRGASRVRYTLGDTTTSFDLPPLTLRDGRLGAPMSVCIPLDGEEPWACAASNEQSTRGPDGAWQPWPSTAPALSQSRVLQMVVEEDPGNASASSAAATFVIPPVLPAPVVDYSALERSLRLHVPGYRADQVEIRYTMDGSTPTSTTGLLYTGAVLLDKRAGNATRFSTSTGQEEETVVHVRAVAFPKLYFASRVAEARVDVSQSISPLTPTSAAPQLQDDEQLSSMPHVQWGSPISIQRTPKLRSASTHQKKQQQYRFLGSSHSPPGGRESPWRSSVLFQSTRPSSARPHSPQSYYASDGNFMTGGNNSSVASDALTTRSAQLRRAFNVGLYTPPRHPFSQGEGYTPSPRRHGRR